MLSLLASTCLAMDKPATLLDANRSVMAAPVSGTLVQSYAYTGEGMRGSASSVVDLAGGTYVERRQAGLSSDAEGFDGKTPWMQDLSRFYSVQDGGNKPAIAIDRAYRNANLWFRADRGGAKIKAIDCNSIEVTPRGGQPFRASFDPATRLLTSIHERSVFGYVRDIRYSDYRQCGAALVPGRIEVSDDDQAASQTYKLQKCALAPPKAARAYSMPAEEPRDWSLPPGGRATVTMRPHDSDVMIKARINGKGPFLFYLDSGGHDILSPRLARELGLKIAGNGRSGGAGETTVKTSYAKVASIDVGGAVLKNQTVVILETSPPEIVGEQIGGVLGVEFFERFVTTLDYQLNSVTFEDPHLFSSAQRKLAGTPVKFKMYEHMPQVAGRFEELPALYNIDTGSGQFVDMTRPFVERTDLRSRYPTAVTIVSGFGTGGASHSTIVRAKSLALGDAAIARVPANLSTAQRGAFSDPAYSGNVGNGILRNFRVTFDYPHETMYLARVANPDFSAYGLNRTGITVVLDGGRATVVDVAAGTPAAQTQIKAGDVITNIGNLDVASHSLREVRQALKEAPVGQPLAIGYRHNGVRATAVVIPRELLPE
jgi:hypothetical protein